MDFVKKYRELKNKRSAQLNKELERRGLRPICCSNDELACDIVAYDAYHAGRSEGLEEARKNVVKPTAEERFPIVLKDEADDEVVFLKITKDQRGLLRYLIDNNWLVNASFTETTRIRWDEP